MNFPDRIAQIVNVFVFDLLEAIFGLLASIFGTLATVFAMGPRPRNE